MRPPKQKQPQVKKGLCRVLEHVDVEESHDPRSETHFWIFQKKNAPIDKLGHLFAR